MEARSIGGRLIGYTIRRLFQLVIVLVGVTLVTFTMLRLVPGDAATYLAGKNASESRIAYIRHQRGLDRPYYIQYVKYVERVLHGDLGASLYNGREIGEMIWEAAPYTLQLALAAVLIELLGIPLGVYAAIRQYGFIANTLTTLALIIWATPGFVLGSLALFVFGYWLGWVPIGVVGSTVLGVIPSGWESLKTLILPALTLGLIGVAYISFMQRATMLEVSRSDFIRTARAKGLGERRVVWVHGFRNALIPVMTLIGIDLGTLIGGTFIIEIVFNRPGIGKLIFGAIADRDPAVIAGSVLFVTIFFVLANLLVDLSYAWVDPRVRLGE